MTPNGKGKGEGFVVAAPAWLLWAAGMLACASQAALAQSPEAWRNEFGMEFVLIPAGEFTMGSTTKLANADERPLRQGKLESLCHQATRSLTATKEVSEEAPPLETSSRRHGKGVVVVDRDGHRFPRDVGVAEATDQF